MWSKLGHHKQYDLERALQAERKISEAARSVQGYGEAIASRAGLLLSLCCYPPLNFMSWQPAACTIPSVFNHRIGNMHPTAQAGSASEVAGGTRCLLGGLFVVVSRMLTLRPMQAGDHQPILCPISCAVLSSAPYSSTVDGPCLTMCSASKQRSPLSDTYLLDDVSSFKPPKENNLAGHYEFPYTVRFLGQHFRSWR